MKFNELHEETKERARDALCAVIASGSVSSDSAKLAGETVATAFIAMEQYENDPQVKIGDKSEEGRSGTGINF